MKKLNYVSYRIFAAAIVRAFTTVVIQAKKIAITFTMGSHIILSDCSFSVLTPNQWMGLYES